MIMIYQSQYNITYLIFTGKWMITKSRQLPPPVFLRTIEHKGTRVLRAGDCPGTWAAVLVLLSPITLLVLTLPVPEYRRFCWEIPGFQVNHSPVSRLARRTAASQSSGRSLPLLLEKELGTLGVSLPWLNSLLRALPAQDRIVTFFPSSFMLLIPMIHKQTLQNRLSVIGCY